MRVRKVSKAEMEMYGNIKEKFIKDVLVDKAFQQGLTNMAIQFLTQEVF